MVKSSCVQQFWWSILSSSQESLRHTSQEWLPYILAEAQTIDTRALKLSEDMMHGNKKKAMFNMTYDQFAKVISFGASVIWPD